MKVPDQSQGPSLKTDYLIQAKELKKVFQIGPHKIHAIKQASLNVRVGETVSIMGVSGVGKSTLMHILGGLDYPTQGQLLYKGEDLFKLSQRKRAILRAQSIGFVFQAYHLLPELDILENVMLPAMSRFRAMKKFPFIQERAKRLLNDVGLSHRNKHRPQELSGGEQQRAALARALMNDPELILADEPTGNLDTQTGNHVLEYLFSLIHTTNEHTLILVTHSERVASFCERKEVMENGRLDINVVQR